MNRRQFMRTTLGGTFTLLAGPRLVTFVRAVEEANLISPGCRRSKVKVAKLYLGLPKAHYPNPAIDPAADRKVYESHFASFKDELSDVEFVVDELVGRPEQIAPLKDRLRNVDGILLIHLSLGTLPAMKEVLALQRPTMIFSAPYSGHEWYYLSEIRRGELGRKMECVLTTDYHELVAAVRPFRALHHLREAKVLDLAATFHPKDFPKQVKDKFGTEITLLERQRVLDAYESIEKPAAQAEAERWTKNAVTVVEPSPEEIFKSCRLALALQKLADEEGATVVTVDCYGSMWRQLPAYPCIGLARLNDAGLGGICQSDLPCVMTHIILQSLTGRPGFVCNPTFNFAADETTLIHCLGSTRMDGPDKPPAPYKLRSVMEREEGAVPQVRMRTGQRVTQAILPDVSTMRYFTGQINGVPETERGCRTQITVKLDGDAEKLWQNWTGGIHRVSCYGDLAKDLTRFCRFAELKLVNEAV